MARFLIVNADDFGLSDGVNRGIIECVEHGIVTSASLMVRWPAAAAAANYAQGNRKFSVGLHVDLGEWVLRNGEWGMLYHVVNVSDEGAVRQEIERQLSEFRRLVGRDPSHLDSHQHVHRKEPVSSIMQALARELNIPLRQFDSRVRYYGGFYGQGGDGESWPELLTVGNLEDILTALPDGATELGCHPGYGEGLESPYRDERAREIQVLCSPETRAAVTRLGFQLQNFSQLERKANSRRGAENAEQQSHNRR